MSLLSSASVVTDFCKEERIISPQLFPALHYVHSGVRVAAQHKHQFDSRIFSELLAPGFSREEKFAIIYLSPGRTGTHRIVARAREFLGAEKTAMSILMSRTSLSSSTRQGLLLGSTRTVLSSGLTKTVTFLVESQEKSGM